MAKTDVHFMLLCFILTAFLSLAASEHKLFNSRSQSRKYTGVQYIQSTDVRETDVDYLIKNKCKFFIVEKTIFFACPKRPTRYPYLNNEVFRDDNGHDDKGEEQYSHSEKFECPFPFGTYPHPKDCRKYHLCLFDKPRTMTCDSSKLYDEYKGECAKKDTVDCGDRTGDVSTKGTTRAPGQQTTSGLRTTTKKVEKFKCPYRWGTFPNPDDCSQYYLCLNKKHAMKKCKPTELYDTEERECRDQDKVDCGSRFNPREKTTKPPATTAATAMVTTSREETASDTFEKSTSQSLSVATSAQDVTEPSSAEASSSFESSTTLTYEVKSTATEIITSEEPSQSTEESTSGRDDSLETDKLESTSENPKTTEENTIGSDEPQPEQSSEYPRITDDVSIYSEKPELTSERPRITSDTSESHQPKSKSEKPEITDTEATESPQTADEDTSITEVLEYSSERPITTEGRTSKTNEPGSVSEEPKSTDDETSGTKEPEPTTDAKITDNDTSESRQPDPTSEILETTDDKVVITSEKSELTSEDVSEVPRTNQPTAEDSSTSQKPDHSENPRTTAEGSLSSKEPEPTEDFRTAATTENVTPSDSSEGPEQETTSSGELVSSFPSDNTNSDKEKSTTEEGKSDYTTEIDTTPQPENTENDEKSSEGPHSTENKIPYSTPSVDSDSTDDLPKTSSEPETTEKERITPEISRPTIDSKEIVSSSSNQVKTSTATFPESFVCPRKKGDFPHIDCSLYYSCRGGAHKVEKCPTGTLFQTVYGICDNEDDVDCGDRKRPDKDEPSSVNYISGTPPTYLPMTGTAGDVDISSGFSTSSDSKDKTVDYTFSDKPEIQSTSDYNTEKTDSPSDFDRNDLTSTGSFETSGISTADSSVETKNTNDYETLKTSESQSTRLISISQKITGSSDSTEDTTTFVSSINPENTEVTTDYSSEESSTYTSRTDSEIYITTDYSTGDTSYASSSTQGDISAKITTGAIKELSTRSTSGDSEYWSTRETPEREIEGSSTEDQSTPITSKTTYSDLQKETTVDDHTVVSITDNEVGSQTQNTDNTGGTPSIATGSNEISTKDTFETDEPEIQTITGDENTFDIISSASTASDEIIYSLTSSDVPISTNEESTSLLTGTALSSSENPIAFKTTDTHSYEPTETTQEHVPSSTTEASTTLVPETTHSSEETMVPSTVQPKEICLVTDKTCIVDEDGNVFRCPKSHGHFAHPWDDYKFLHCDNFRIHVIDCPSGLRFEPKHNICTWPAVTKK